MKEKKQTFMNSVILLMISQVIIKVAGLLYKIYLTNKSGFGDAGNAIYSAGFQIYTLLLAISSIGVPNTIAQLISKRTAIGDNKGAYRVFKVAISIFSIIGFIGSSFMFLKARSLANDYLGIPEAELAIIALSPSVFIVAIASVLRGYFNGREQIGITANSQSVEQILKTILTIVIVEIFSIYFKSNTVVMVAGAAVATTISTCASLVYLYIFFIKNRKNIWKDVLLSSIKEKESLGKIVKTILGVSLPIAFTALLSTASKSIDAFTVVNIVGNYLGTYESKLQYGILTGKVEGLIVLPYSFNIAFATTLVPTISAAQARGESEKATKRVKFSILSTILITLPCMAVLFVFAEPILKMLFPRAYMGAEMLKLASLSIVFVAITQTIGGVLQGLNKIKATAIAITIGLIVKLILNIALLPIKHINIYGAIISTIISHITTFIVSFIYLKKYIKTKFKISKYVIKPIIATCAMIVSILYIYNNVIIINSNITLILSFIIGIIMYVLSILVLRILSEEEICMLPFGNKFYKWMLKK